MATTQRARLVVLWVSLAVIASAAFVLLAPGVRGSAPSRRTAAAPPATSPAPTTSPADPARAGTVPATSVATAAVGSGSSPATAVAAGATGPAGLPGAGAAAAGGRGRTGGATATLASTGLSSWWPLGALGAAALGIVLVWSELVLRPIPALARWWGPHRPRHLARR